MSKQITRDENNNPIVVGQKGTFVYGDDEGGYRYDGTVIDITDDDRVVIDHGNWGNRVIIKASVLKVVGGR
jgi:hypothetical protein